MSIEIEPQYLHHEDDAGDAEYEQMPMLSQVGGITHQMMVDGVLSMPGTGIEGAEEQWEEADSIEAPEFTKFKRDKVFISADHTRRKTKIIATIG